jgi:hypothetical protein
VLFAEVRAEFDQFRRQASDLQSVREHLFAAYLSVGRAALAPAEWFALDSLLGSTSDLMGIGPPWADVPIAELERSGERDRPQEARRRINALIPEFQARLSQLASGGGTSACEALEEAAA